MEVVKRKVLIIPSWYPTKANAVIGSFFLEQAQLMQDVYDIKVLFGYKDFIGYKRFLLRKFQKLLNLDKKNRFDNYLALTPPEAINFSFPFIPTIKDEKNLDCMQKAYDKELTCLISEGWKPDLIHAQCTVDAGIVAAYLGEKYNIPTIITEHQVFLLFNYSKFLQKKVIEALEKVSKVAAVSYHQMRCILMHQVNCNPIVVGNYINENHFSFKKRVEGKKFRILTITNADYIKDNDTLFKAIALLVAKGHTDISLTVISSDFGLRNFIEANKSKFKDLAVKYNVLQYCNFVPNVKRENMPAQYHEHDVLVSTSIAETFGVSICEAMSTGMPVVTTSCGGVDDTVNNTNGIKVPIKDYQAVADALINIKIKAIIFKPEEVRSSIVNKFGYLAFRNKLIELYNGTMLS